MDPEVVNPVVAPLSLLAAPGEKADLPPAPATAAETDLASLLDSWDANQAAAAPPPPPVESATPAKPRRKRKTADAAAAVTTAPPQSEQPGAFLDQPGPGTQGSLLAPPATPRSAKEAARRALELALRAALLAGLAATRSRRVRQACSIALFAGVFLHASHRVSEIVRGDVQYRVSKASLAATVPPRGLAREAVDDLADIAIPGRSFSVYDPAAVPLIAASYARLPWVREVKSVEVRFPAVVRFDVSVRRPVCGLSHMGRTYLLDDEGVLLPRRCYEPSEPDALRLPTIIGAQQLGRRALAEGQRLDDTPIKHGIAVALALQAEAFDELRASAPVSIDVANVDGRVDPRQSEIVVTAGRTVIERRRSPATTKLDIPVDEKIAKLRPLLDRDPSLASLSLVRLQFDDLEFRERRVTPVGAQ